MEASFKKQVSQHLEIEAAFGITHLVSPAGSLTARPILESREQKTKSLDALREEYKNCQMCPLSRGRTHVVFGSGNPEAELMFVGEAPGYDEDLQALPFVGKAGQLLTKIIEAMKLKREDVYIANCLKCRPPQNRNPLPSEIVICSPILEKQIEIIQPKVICALGKFAAQTLLKTDEPIGRLRGRFFDWHRGIKLMPTFHPVYLLRNPGDKKIVWEDVQKIMKELEVSI